MLEQLETWSKGSQLIDRSTLGESAGGLEIPMVRIGRGSEPARWRVMFVGQQHGDEVAGKEALLAMIEALAGDADRLPPHVALWIVPMLNPDGAAVHQRRNAAGVDLNRDHLLLEQPETRALHTLVREVKPHVFVDCHEFTRDSADYRDRGLGEWPLIMMDATNHPLLPSALRRAALDWLDRADARLSEKGIAYRRYTVGGVPPDQEQRYSTLEADDARNGVGLHGTLSFIVESGVRRDAPDPHADLARRVEAYLELLWPFVIDGSTRKADRTAVESARGASLPAYVPTNAFWAQVLDDRFSPRTDLLGGPPVSRYPVVDAASGETRWIDTPNLMTRIVVKRSEPAPRAYAIPAAVAGPFKELLERHGLPYRELTETRPRLVETCRLVRIEDDHDEVYERYAGRQIVRRLPEETLELTAGSLIVPLEPPSARRAVALLEPTMLYGLYQHERFRALVDEEGTVPVLRVLR
jgi:hypothetical protein